MTEVIHSSSASPSSSPSLYQARDLVDEEEAKGGNKEKDQLSLLALLVALFRKSFWMACKTERAEHCCSAAGMEIGWPTNVRHISHVTFDRFNGFLGLPVEFEPEVPRRSPSAR
ncbi:unnamed protein product [Cuscuta epithymum]|uniref:CRIB domain-containing protein n=1 Tax=Cuscuta epithymum TaxID=186058 RepID=A0AAV0GJN1_9ASTE|nr:unnamed protein product [Cuscuta epithymum]